MTKQKIVVLSGAGMSAESGLKTFRDADGLWEGHDVMEVDSIEGWHANQSLVLEFYNQRRRQLLKVSPNKGHLALVKLESKYDVSIVTQNVDDLHERAGSNNIIHLHGELLKACSVKNKSHVVDCSTDILLGDTALDGQQLRPFIVWFGEDVPLLYNAVKLVEQADIVLIIGTSMQVYPAASLVEYAKSNAKIFYVDPKPQINHALAQSEQLTVLEDSAGNAIPTLVEQLLAR